MSDAPTYDQGGKGFVLLLLYSAVGTVLHLTLALFRPLVELLGGRWAYGLAERLGRYPQVATGPGERVLWLHASSVGEVQAALVLLDDLTRSCPGLRVVLTTTTEQGHRLAESRLPAEITCLMAPLDVVPAVRRALRTVRPDLYVCLETELWPVMLTRLRRAGVPMALVNGRLSERSCRRYRHIRSTMARLLGGFASLAVITEADGRRFVALGADASRIRVCGNLKYDMPADDPEATRRLSRARLGASDETVFVCGSTHEGEEEQLLAVYRRLAERGPLVFVLAPRHLERVEAVAALLGRAGVDFDRFSQLATGDRTAPTVLVDTMGDLADLYAGGDYLFCGGSLVDRGGHNIIEAARWGRPVFFGPHMKDFRDAADMLIEAGGGFQVSDVDALATRVLALMDDPDRSARACACAAAAAAGQRGAVRRQADMVRRLLVAG